MTLPIARIHTLRLNNIKIMTVQYISNHKMFVVNWFKRQQSPETKQDTIIIKKEEYDELIQRLNKLEEMMDNLPIVQPPNPPPMPTCLPRDECNECLKMQPIVKTETQHNQVPFQHELEKRLKMIRERMGSSHGWDNCELNNIDDLDNLEQSVLEKSLMMAGHPNIPRTHSPVKTNFRTNDEAQLSDTPPSIPIKKIKLTNSPSDPPNTPESPIVRIFDNYLL